MARRSAKALDAGLGAFSLSLGIVWEAVIPGLRQVVKSGKTNGNWYYAIGTYFVRYDDGRLLVVDSGVRHGGDVTRRTCSMTHDRG